MKQLDDVWFKLSRLVYDQYEVWSKVDCEN